MLRWLIGIILGEIICKLATYIQRSKITILGANWQLFSWEMIAKCSYFIFLYTKHQVLLICNENKEICVAKWVKEISPFET